MGTLTYGTTTFEGLDDQALLKTSILLQEVLKKVDGYVVLSLPATDGEHELLISPGVHLRFSFSQKPDLDEDEMRPIADLVSKCVQHRWVPFLA